MAVLVVYASRHGATAEIARWIADRLRRRGLEAEARSVADAGDLSGRDAYVIGSAIYYGSWLRKATAFVRRSRAALAGRPVWLFSSGPLDGFGEEAFALPPDLEERIRPRGHRVFGGALERSRLTLTERLVARGISAPEGDFRDRAEIDAWADGIARELTGSPGEHLPQLGRPPRHYLP